MPTREISSLNVVAIAGGVGGAKLADGLAQALSPGKLSVIVNIGDDFDHLGLRICPDLDTVCYTLAGLANPTTGWGRAGETWQAMENLALLGGPTWFRLGDMDLATHLERTQRLTRGERLSEITHDFCRAWGITSQVFPVTDDPVPTIVHADEGDLPFQEYFVRRQCNPRVKRFSFEDVSLASPAPGVLDALTTADLVVFCPSNPWVSIDPILAVPGIREVIREKHVIAVSPLIGGKAVKGPAAKMYAELGVAPTAYAVAAHYQELLSDFVFDNVDAAQEADVRKLGVRSFVTDTLMHTPLDRKRLAEEVLRMAITAS